MGGGRKKRALARGYSSFTPLGLKDMRHLQYGTPRVQPRLWMKITPQGGERSAKRRVRGFIRHCILQDSINALRSWVNLM